MARYEVRCVLPESRILFQGVLWGLAILLTAGIATVFFPYAITKTVLNHVEINEVS